jgi:CelD/BcsL family acetyltransferase involved in cellulose biosynthesis
MRLRVLRTFDEFNGLAGEWNDLLAESASHVPFLRHEYLVTWWRSLGGGGWSQGELYIVAAEGEDGRLAGIAPLFLTQDGRASPAQPEAALLLLGSHEISDYLDVIARPDDLAPFLGLLFEHLANPAAPAWSALDFYNLLESSPTLPELAEAARRCGWQVVLEPLQHCPAIPLPGDWETYLAGIDKKQRHEIRRKMRRAESAEEPVRWYIAQDETRLEGEIEAFLTLMAQDAEKAAFLTAKMRAQMREIIWAAFRGGWLQLAFIEVGGEKAAAYLNFDYANQIWVYNSGIDFRFSAYSPGWVLLGHLLQWANEHGRAAFDFMRGEEDYKYRFGGVDRRVLRARVTR